MNEGWELCTIVIILCMDTIICIGLTYIIVSETEHDMNYDDMCKSFGYEHYSNGKCIANNSITGLPGTEVYREIEVPTKVRETKGVY